MTSYPYSIDNNITIPPASGEDATSINANIEATVAIETTLGILPMGVYASVRTRLDILEARINNPYAPSPNVENPFFIGNTGVTIQTGFGSPTVLAVPGSLYLREDGYDSQGLYSFRPDGYWTQIDTTPWVAGGDLSGDATTQTVIGLQNNAIQSGILTSNKDGYVLTWSATNNEWFPAPNAAIASEVFWNGDLANSTNTLQYISSISGLHGAGGNLALNINGLVFSATQTAPNISQTDRSPTSSGAGAAGRALSISSQDGQTTTASSSGGGGGGALTLFAGNGGTAGPGGTDGTGGVIVIESGNGGGTNGPGGGITFTGGSGEGTGSGGHIGLIGGVSGSGNGGTITIQGGTPSSGSSYGSVSLVSNTKSLVVSHTNITLPSLGGSGTGYVAVDNSGNLTFNTLPASLPPSGSAGGDLSGTYPNPIVAKANNGNIVFSSSGIAFASTVVAPQITQPIGSGIGATLTIQSQGGGANSTGGTLSLSAGNGGVGNSYGGNVFVEAGAGNGSGYYGDINIVAHNNSIVVSPSNVAVSSLAGFGDGYVAVDNDGYLSWSSISSSGSSGFTANAVVFSPSNPSPTGNVFTDFSTLCSTIFALGGVWTIEFDGSFVNGQPTIIAGTYSLPPNVSFVGLGAPPGASYGYPSVIMDADVVFSPAPGELAISNMTLFVGNNTNPNITASGDFFELITNNVNVIESGTQPFISLLSNESFKGYLSLTDFTGGVLTATSGCSATLILTNQCNMGGGSILPIDASIYSIQLDATCAIDSSQTPLSVYTSHQAFTNPGTFDGTSSSTVAMSHYVVDYRADTTGGIVVFQLPAVSSIPFDGWSCHIWIADGYGANSITISVDGGASEQLMNPDTGSYQSSTWSSGTHPQGTIVEIEWYSGINAWLLNLSSIQTVGGDLSGTLLNPKVIALQGNAVDSETLGSSEDGYALVWNNTASHWQASAIRNGFGAYSSRPISGNAGAIFIASDGIVTFVDDGSEWRPMIQGVPGWEVAPNNSTSNLTQVGFSPTTVNVQGGCVYLYCDNAGSNTLCGFERPKIAGQTVIAHILPFAQPQPNSGFTGNVSQAAVWVRDTSSGKLEGVFFGKGGYTDNYNYIALNTYSTLSSLNASTSGGILPFTNGIWVRIDDTGSENKFSWSQDGQNWVLYGTDTYVPSQGNVYGFGVNPNGYPSAMTVDSFHVASLIVEPTFSLVTPNIGTSAGGWTINLTGTGFQTGASVSINGQPCTSVVVNSPTSITCVAPAYSTPNGSITGQTIIITNTDTGTVSSSGISTQYYYLPSNNEILFAHRADTNITTGNSGTTTAIIGDMTANGNNWDLTAFPANQPTAPSGNFSGSGLPYIPFVYGNSNYLPMASFSTPVTDGVVSLFTVMQLTDVSGAVPTNVCFYQTSSSSDYTSIIYNNSNGQLAAVDSIQDMNFGSAADTNPHVLGLIVNNASSFNYLDGGSAVSGTQIAAPNLGNETCYIGFNAGGFYYSNMNYLADIFYVGAVTDADALAVQSILMTTSGV